MTDITDARILILATHGFEQSELEVPRDQLREKGATVHVATPDGQAIRGWNEKDWGEMADADLALGDVDVGDYDALVLPGGQINPDILRLNDTAVKTVAEFCNTGKIVAAICHAPWLLIEANVLHGRDATSYASVATDVRNAGANWHDREVVVDAGIVTSRSPDDLEAFVTKIVEEIGEGRHDRAGA